MKNSLLPRVKKFAFLSIILLSTTVISQVGIGTITPSAGAILDITSDDKGVLLPRVELTGTDDMSTVTPEATTGLLVYNTVIDGAPAVQVTPGFYYWNGSQWARLYNQGYTLKYEQTDEVIADVNNTIYSDLKGLDTGSIQVPFSGTYQILINAFYTAGDLISTSSDGAGQGSIGLFMSTNGGTEVNLKEIYLTSSSKQILSTSMNGLAQNGTILINVDLDANDTYTFVVRGREWLTNNVNTGYFGRDTSAYSGSSGVDTAMKGAMSITLVKQQ